MSTIDFEAEEMSPKMLFLVMFGIDLGHYSPTVEQVRILT